MRQGLGEGGDMLTGTGSDFQHPTLGRQHAGQHLQDRGLVAAGCGEIQAGIVGR